MSLLDDLRSDYKVECRRCGHFNSDMTPVRATVLAAAARIEELEALADRLAEALLSWHPEEVGDAEDLAALAAWREARTT